MEQDDNLREITDHKVEGGAYEPLRLFAIDEPGPGGANHNYVITMSDATSDGVRLRFQKGPIQEAGVNGNVSNETLLAIVKDRLEGFQKGPYACTDNSAALSLVVAALGALKDRTAARVRRGVEGTSAQ